MANPLKGISLLLTLLLLSACSSSPAANQTDSTSAAPSAEAASSEKSTEEAEPAQPSEAESTAAIQQQMAVDTLTELMTAAESGTVYQAGNGAFKIGETTRDNIIEALGEPTDSESGFDRYSGSMGNATFAFSYSEENVLEEARYYGTNVERQTNLGGLVPYILTDRLGEPDEQRDLQETGESVFVYRTEEHEVQFVIGTELTVDHVNLLAR